MDSELKNKYNEEREKRVRAPTSKQLSSFRSAALTELDSDLFVDHDAIATEEPPLKDGDKIKFLIVGGGHNGIVHAHHLIKAGFKTEDIVIVDNAGGWGGTWYWNRYPGLMCDVEGYCYLPLLEETGYMPKHKYSYGAEIRGQSERAAARFGLRGMFCTKVEKTLWDEKVGRWITELKRTLGAKHDNISLTVEAQFLISAGGVFYSPAFPDLPGFTDFRQQKHVFHTSRWDYDITGGSQLDPSLHKLKDKRVGIIGTGATAIQVVPHLAKWGKHLYVFQRTPSYCGPRGQMVTDPSDWKKIAYKEGWQLERRENFNHFISDNPQPLDLVSDGWSNHRSFAGIVGTPKDITPENYDAHLQYMYDMDAERANRVRAHIASQVKDPATAEKLKPWYPGWCKRPTFHDDYLSSFNQSNVTLVDTDGKGVEAYTTNGVVANGSEYELDVIVLATGFFSSSSEDGSPAVRMGAPVTGRDGQDLGEKWISEDFGTLFGVATHGFPNLFFHGNSGTGSSPNLTSAFDASGRIIAHIVAEACKRGDGDGDRVIVSVSKEAEEKYTHEVMKRAHGYRVLTTCTPGYFAGYPSETRKQSRAGLKRAGWGYGLNDYYRMTGDYITKGTIEGIQIDNVVHE
ncbi:hypothetical protein KJ359_010384 [Pestalotiopsis sp. 9143b]|nr:hypothetical protein KJ359_010384 [Pestalotiopsis sp. 9143b]